MKKIKNLFKKINMDFAVKMSLGIALSVSLFLNLTQASEITIHKITKAVTIEKYGLAIKEQRDLIHAQRNLLNKFIKQNTELDLYNKVLMDLLKKMKEQLDRSNKRYEA